jgi:hypothetical protein
MGIEKQADNPKFWHCLLLRGLLGKKGKDDNGGRFEWNLKP